MVWPLQSTLLSIVVRLFSPVSWVYNGYNTIQNRGPTRPFSERKQQVKRTLDKTCLALLLQHTGVTAYQHTGIPASSIQLQ